MKNDNFIALLLLTLLALFIRIIFVNGMLLDQSIEIANASFLFSSEYNSLTSQSDLVELIKTFMRELANLPNDIVFLAPITGVLYFLFGVSDYSSILLPLASSLAIVVLVYMLGKSLISNSAGLIAAFIWAVLPISIFLSTNLLPILPIVFLNAFATLLFLKALERKSNPLFILSTMLVLAGIYIEWRIFLPTLIFYIYSVFSTSNQEYFRRFGKIAGLIALAFLVIPGRASQAINLYYLALLIFDNFLIIPLLLSSIVFVVKEISHPGHRLILMWLAIKATFMVIAAKWIIEDTLVNSIGLSAYWLDFIIPAILLIAWQLSHRIHVKKLVAVLNTISASGILGLTILFSVFGSLPTFMFVLSRISVGLAFLSIPGIYVFFNTNFSRRNLIVRSLFLFLFLIASLSITNTYIESYSSPQSELESAFNHLVSTNRDVDLLLEDGSVYDGFLYLAKFRVDSMQHGNNFTINVLNPRKQAQSKEGSYILISEEYLQFEIGEVPVNWKLFEKFQSSKQSGLLLYIRK